MGSTERQSDKKVTVFWREAGRDRDALCGTRSILSENHLYTVYGPDGSYFHGEKRVFQDLDDKAVPAFHWLADGDWRNMPDQYADPFYRFIYNLEPRSKQMRDRFVRRDELVLRELRNELRSRGVPNLEPLMETIRQHSPKDRAAFAILAIAKADTAWRKLFYNIPSYVYDLSSFDLELFTSDAPLSSIPTIDAEDALFILPLSRSRCWIASHDPSKVETLCANPPALFASVVNLRTLSRATTAIARDVRFRDQIFSFLGCAVNPAYMASAVARIYEGSLSMGVGMNVSASFVDADDQEAKYRTIREAFCAGIDGAVWGTTSPAIILRAIGPCERLMMETRAWSLQNSTETDAYKIGRALSYIFFQLDQWGQPVEVATKLRTHLRHHSVSYVRYRRQQLKDPTYTVEVLLEEFRRAAREALEQLYFNVDDHASEVKKYVQYGFL